MNGAGARLIGLAGRDLDYYQDLLYHYEHYHV